MISTRTSFFLLMLILLGSSCQQEKEPAPQQPIKEELKTDCLLQRIINQDGLSGTEEEFDNQRREIKLTHLKSVSGKAEVAHYVTFEYDANGKIDRLNQYGQDADAFFGGASLNLPDYLTIIPEYDSEGRVTVMKASIVTSATTTVFRTVQYEYNGQGQLLKATTDKGGYRRFEYNSDGDIAKVFNKGEQASSKEYLGVEFSSYDDKNYMLLKNKARNLYILYYGIPFTKHNITAASYYLEDGKLSFSDKATYEYNDNGFPVKKINVRTQNNSTNTTTIGTYQYNCR